VGRLIRRVAFIRCREKRKKIAGGGLRGVGGRDDTNKKVAT